MDRLFTNCHYCGGSGLVENRAPEWQAYFQVYEEEGSTAAEAVKPAAGSSHFPCGECDGKGIHLTPDGETVVSLLKRLKLVS